MTAILAPALLLLLIATALALRDACKDNAALRSQLRLWRERGADNGNVPLLEVATYPRTLTLGAATIEVSEVRVVFTSSGPARAVLRGDPEKTYELREGDRFEFRNQRDELPATAPPDAAQTPSLMPAKGQP